MCQPAPHESTGRAGRRSTGPGRRFTGPGRSLAGCGTLVLGARPTLHARSKDGSGRAVRAGRTLARVSAPCSPSGRQSSKCESSANILIPNTESTKESKTWPNVSLIRCLKRSKIRRKVPSPLLYQQGALRPVHPLFRANPVGLQPGLGLVRRGAAIRAPLQACSFKPPSTCSCMELQPGALSGGKRYPPRLAAVAPTDT